MKRLATLLSAAVLATALAMFSPASPVSADTDPCAGAGTAFTAPLYYPVYGPKATGGFSFTLDLAGTCGAKATVTAGGELNGYCGLSYGRGTANGGHEFSFVGTGGELIITGQLTGVATAVPDATNGQSCTTGATRFIVAGSVLKNHTIDPVEPDEKFPPDELPCVTCP